VRWSNAIAVILALAAGFGLGRTTAPLPEPEPLTVASFRAALENPDWLARTYGVSAFLRELSPENLPAALEVYEAQLPWLVTDEQRLFMLAWSRFDVAAALERALSWPRRFVRNGSGAAIYAWAYRDPEGAVQALEQVSDPELKGFMERRMIAGWAHGRHKQSANQYIASVPGGPRRFEYAGVLAWEYSKQGTEAVMRWADEIPDVLPRYKAASFIKAATTVAALDAPAAARWVTENLDKPYVMEALRSVARSWGVDEPRDALDWLMTLPAGGERDAAIPSAWGIWLAHAPKEAVEWLDSETPARVLDPAVRMLMDKARESTPAVAMRWSVALADPQRLADYVTEIGRDWLRREPELARAWLAQSELPEEIRGAILAGDS
jgi:hypothetical protein